MYLTHSLTIGASDVVKVPIIYIDPMGDEQEVEAEVGKNLLDIAHDNDIELEGNNHSLPPSLCDFNFLSSKIPFDRLVYIMLS